jgi:predicted O-methyltransferase YrrM
VTTKSHITGATLKSVREPEKWQKEFAWRTGSHEKATNLKLMKLLKDCPDDAVVVESGGHVGDTTMWMSDFLRSKGIRSHVVTFEPDPSKWCFISGNIAANNLSSYVQVRKLGLVSAFSVD